MMKISPFLGIGLLLFACSPGGIGHGSNDHTGGLPEYQEHESNNSIFHSQFIGTFNAPDLIHIYGQFNTQYDRDVYHLFTIGPQLLNINVATDHVPVEAYLITKNPFDNTLILIGHWVGDPNQLQVLGWPINPLNDGIYLILHSPSGIMGLYNAELWVQ